VLAFRLAGLHLSIVDIALQTEVMVIPVGAHRAAGFHNLGNEPVQGLSARVRRGGQPDPASPFAISLSGHQQKNFLLPASTSKPCFFSTPEGLIHLY
jgi:hypothetical protein